jgi:seryl-tRNA synthetase
MVNILETQQHANKELSSEIEALKKQLTDKEQETEQLKEDLKLKIWHITGQPTDAF